MILIVLILLVIFLYYNYKTEYFSLDRRPFEPEQHPMENLHYIVPTFHQI